MAEPEDDEWEYEYDEEETEVFYIPIDMSNVPASHAPLVSGSRQGHPVLLKSRLRALNAQRGQQVEPTSDPSQGQSAATMGEVQVTGLHTPNPLIMHNGQLLSCHWTSTIGTDMFFVKPGTSTGESSESLRSLPAVDLLGVGSAKLIAKVGTMRPRDEVFAGSNESQPESGLADTSSLPKTAQSQRTENQPGTETTLPPPNSFLGRLNQAKAKRGESTRLVISNSAGESRLVAEPIPEDVRTEVHNSSHSSKDAVMGGMSEVVRDTEDVNDTREVDDTGAGDDTKDVDDTRDVDDTKGADDTETLATKASSVSDREEDDGINASRHTLP